MSTQSDPKPQDSVIEGIRRGDPAARAALHAQYDHLAHWTVIERAITWLSKNQVVDYDKFIRQEIARSKNDDDREASQSLLIPPTTKSYRRKKIQEAIRAKITECGVPDLGIPLRRFLTTGRGLSNDDLVALCRHFGLPFDPTFGKRSRRPLDPDMDFADYSHAGLMDDIAETFGRNAREQAVFRALEDGHEPNRRALSRATGLSEHRCQSILNEFKRRTV